MAQNPSPSLLDPGQIIKRSYDEANDRIRVDASITVSAATQEVVIDHADDSIRIGNGTSLITATTIGAGVGLDVNLIGGVVSGSLSPVGLSQGIKSWKITVTDVRRKLPLNPYSDRNTLSIRIGGVEPIYLGNSNVSVAGTETSPGSGIYEDAGYPKYQLEEFAADVITGSSTDIWGVCEAGKTSYVWVIEIG